MADYWKSQPRKFCDYCKCWITDNKPSVEFHEKGKRHQENVKNKISELRKKGIEDYKKKQEMSDSMKEMEKAALEALKKDLTSDPSMAAQYGIQLEPGKKINFIEKKTTGQSESSGKSTAESRSNHHSTDLSTSSQSSTSDTESKAPQIIEWFEAVSDEGYTYYWNICTGESIWEAPAKYKSLAEQNQEQTQDGSTEQTSEKDSDQKSTTEELEADVEPGVAGPLPKTASSSSKAYGGWTQVKEEELPDLQLPVSNITPEAEKVFVPEEPKMKFREKKVTSLDTTGSISTTFKKRKTNTGAARSIRKRDDDDS